MAPKMSYFVLASHRSGSSLLCEQLTLTGVAGKPGEYFIHWEGSSYKEWDISDYPSYVNRVIEDTMSDNGIFAAKVMTGVLGGIEGAVAEFRKNPDYANTPVKDLLNEYFPNVKFIYLTRRNKVAQAVSWWKAVQNDQYFLTEGVKPSDKELKYNPEAISALITEVVMEEASHQEFLNFMGVTPYPVVYEDFVQNMPETVNNILNFLGIEDEPQPFKKSGLIKQADALSDEWVERYRQEQMAKAINERWTTWLREPVSE